MYFIWDVFFTLDEFNLDWDEELIRIWAWLYNVSLGGRLKIKIEQFCFFFFFSCCGLDERKEKQAFHCAALLGFAPCWAKDGAPLCLPRGGWLLRGLLRAVGQARHRQAGTRTPLWAARCDIHPALPEHPCSRARQLLPPVLAGSRALPEVDNWMLGWRGFLLKASGPGAGLVGQERTSSFLCPLFVLHLSVVRQRFW